MAKQATITEIAKKAGVSIGTIDRVIHNRRGVSPESLRKVRKILDEVGYKSNLHTSAVALRKSFRFVVTTPLPGKGEYWDKLLNGIRTALEEYSDIPISLELHPYDQFSPESCRTAFEAIPGSKADAVIIGPSFEEETLALCSSLEANSMPYIFVDTMFPRTNPLSSFTADQPAGGALVAKILDSITPPGKSIVQVLPRLGDGAKAQNAEQRRQGFLHYFSGSPADRTILELETDFLASDISPIRRFFRAHPDVAGACVFNSRGSIIADALREEGRDDVRILAFDMTDSNLARLREGSIFALICQRPERQGFLAVTTLLEHLLYKRLSAKKQSLMPLDIVLRENLDYYD